MAGPRVASVLLSLLGWSFGVVATVGCGISPQPLPPGDELGVDASLLTLETSAVEDVRLVGAPGSVQGATSLRITNLDGTAPFVDAVVDDEGALSQELDGGLADVLRLQALEGEERSEPLDVTGDGEAEPVAIPPVATPCLTLSPPLELVGEPVGLADPVQVLEVVALNDCTTDVVLGGAALRGTSSFTMLTGPGAFPQQLTPGASFTVVVGFKSMTTGDFEDVLFLSLDAADGPRRAITVRSTTQ